MKILLIFGVIKNLILQGKIYLNQIEILHLVTSVMLRAHLWGKTMHLHGKNK
jgi:hypothetical protein